MIGRPASPFLVSILLIVQAVAGPFTHAAPMLPTDMDCDHAVPAAHGGTDAIAGCAECPDMQLPAPKGSHAGEHHCATHAACSCPCAHTPALGVDRLVIMKPALPEAVDTVLAAGTLDPPLFDFLRPPN